jgi:aminoglycoside/choline kinase family phosphotransferase
MADLDFLPLSELVLKVGGDASFSHRPMPGGASTRSYFRVALSSAKSAVAMFVPEGGKPEEIHKAADHRRWPFLEVRELLASRGVHVPRILAEDTDRGWLLLEDLGDDTLANVLLAHPEKKAALYTQAVTDLARAQASLSTLPDDCVVKTRSFDEDLLRLEIDHFREWGLDARGKSLTPSDRAIFDGIASRLAKRIAALPYGFTHRDYQSRNLMVRPAGELTWIDFQDALLGPRVYDLVALLNDSYQEFDRPFVLSRLDEFAAVAKLATAEREALELQFDLVTVQRKLKDAGRFVYIDRVKQNASFVRFVSPTVAKVKSSLARLSARDEDMRALGEILARALPDE